MGTLLEGKVAVVTGGSSGIGRATSLLFAAEGADVVVADLQREPREGGEPTDDLVRAAGRQSRYVRCDVTSQADVETAMAAADELGGVDVLLNNAGIFFGGDFLETTEADYDRMMDVNVKSVFFVAQAAARRMVAKGGGSIINLSSIAGLQGMAPFTTYCMAKGAVRLMTYALAQELGPRNVRVNALHPGVIGTTMTMKDVPVVGHELGEVLLQSIPMGRHGKPEDVARAALYLASDLSGYVSGDSLRVDGGMMRI